jgi:hypothetical protein
MKMGMYTQLALNVWLKPSNDPQRFAILKLMCEDGYPEKPDNPPMDHPLFKTDRWFWMMRSGGSFYFHGSKLSGTIGELETINGCHPFSIWTDIKNYTGEWESFLDFITPLVDDDLGDLAGFLRYEEADMPTLIRFRGGTLEMQEIDPSPAQRKDER